ncbi:MAG: hypothetical protein BGO49_22745 [Planctomycetales bacterium 71-10]|nr:MAG: hypothetical protein BGO49_22745 [Planctomycetales bacterium 71-10]
MTRYGWLFVAFWPLAAMGQAPAPGSGPASAPDALAIIKAEAESARDSFHNAIRELRKETFDAGVKAASEARRVRQLSLMDRALTLARLHPGDSEGLAAATWVVTETALAGVHDVGGRDDAAYRLLADNPVLDDTAMVPAIFLADDLVPRCPEAENFLRSVISRSRNRELVTLARCELGFYLAEMARMHDRLGAPISGPALTKELNEVRLDRCRAIDAPKLRTEAEALLEQVVREDAELGLNVGQPAAGELYRIRNLNIGQPAPELIGEDIDGAPFWLSEFRGKVVVLSFWTTSSDPQRGKDLLAAMKGRPFALVGVNGDAEDDRAKVQEFIAKEGITWRSFWAGGPDGKIPRKWGVRSWPTAYVIDAAGIIRDDQVGEKVDPEALRPLIQAAE